MPIHYVEIESVVNVQLALLAACGESLVHRDWSTDERIVTCPTCRVRLGHSPVAPDFSTMTRRP